MISDAQAEWIEESRRLTLTILANLASLAARSGSFRLGTIVRDLADHAQMWAESMTNANPDLAGNGPIDFDLIAEAATYTGRCAAGLRRRLDIGSASLPREPGRIAIACAADLDDHLGWADRVIRSLERGGLAESTRRCQVLLPSRSEFLGQIAERPLAFTSCSEHPAAHENHPVSLEHAPGHVGRDALCGGLSADHSRPGGRGLGGHPGAEDRLGSTAADS